MPEFNSRDKQSMANTLNLLAAASQKAPFPLKCGATSAHVVTAQVPPLACPGTPLYGGLWATLRTSKMFFRLKTACRSRFAGVPGQLQKILYERRLRALISLIRERG